MATDIIGLALRVLPAVSAICCFGFQPSHAMDQVIESSQETAVHDERSDRIGEAVRETMRKEGLPGISVAVVENGKIAWAQGFGYRDVRRRLPVDTDTEFQAGSISKPVTALAVLILNASGKVDLDQDVNRYLKGWRLDSKFVGSPITLRKLLCHRAGMVPHGFLGFRERKQAPSLAEVLQHDIKVRYPPGSRFRYSGGGYCVVQKVVEDVTGESFEAAVNELVLAPLGMGRSSFRQPPEDANNLACGYGWIKTLLGGGRWRIFPQEAAAGLWTTPQDLARFIVAVQGAASGKTAGPISPAIVREFLKPQFDAWEGTGVFLEGTGEGRAFFHAGENPGYFARFGASVSKGHGWVVMSNGQKDKFGEIVNAIRDQFRWNQGR
jgi:CubicO group peptidase (beta-lactamase class C family)